MLETTKLNIATVAALLYKSISITVSLSEMQERMRLAATNIQ